jgi:hypothetical protein
MANKYFSEAIYRYNLLPIKLRLFIGMLIAANSAALAIYFSLGLIDGLGAVDYWVCLGVFLAYRVAAFMANKQMPLTDENVAFMSSERTLWNLATIAVLAVMFLVKQIIS